DPASLVRAVQPGKRLSWSPAPASASPPPWRIWGHGKRPKNLASGTHTRGDKHGLQPGRQATGHGLNQLATGSIKDTITLWDVASGQEYLNLRGYGGNIGNLAFSPDGKRLAIASSAGKSSSTIKVLDASLTMKEPLKSRLSFSRRLEATS